MPGSLVDQPGRVKWGDAAGLYRILVLDGVSGGFLPSAAWIPGPRAPSTWEHPWLRIERATRAVIADRLTCGACAAPETSDPTTKEQRRDLVPGASVTLIGYVGPRPTEFVAWFLDLPSSDNPAASPTLPERAKPAPARVQRHEGSSSWRPPRLQELRRFMHVAEPPAQAG